MPDFIPFDIWQFLAGLGLFLMAMKQLESSLKQLVGHKFKQYLLESTKTPLRAIIAGTFATMILQSSSLVSLLTLAFVGARILSLSNAIGIVIGANLGTTATGWLVVALGFSLDIQASALPLIAIGAISIFWFTKETKPHALATLILGLGLLLFGIDYMKQSMEYLANNFELTGFAGQPAIVFLIIGVVFTALVQSSSAAMVVTLSALNADVISLQDAAATIIGADLGTTITVVLGALHSSPDTKRVAAAHVLFNLVTDILAFVFLLPLLSLVANASLNESPLMALVAFHSLFNILGILIFFPWLNKFGLFLKKRFHKKIQAPTHVLHNISPDVPEAAIAGLNQELRLLANDSMALCLAGAQRFTNPEGLSSGQFLIRYQSLKDREKAILSFIRQLKFNLKEEQQNQTIITAISALRSFILAAKALRDLRHDVDEITKVNQPEIHIIVAKLVVNFEQLISKFNADLQLIDTINNENGDKRLIHLARQHHAQLVQLIVEDNLSTAEEMPTSTLLNINHEFFHSIEFLVEGLALIKR